MSNGMMATINQQIDYDTAAIVVSDASWIWVKAEKKDWARVDFDTKGWQHAAEIAAVTGPPWNLGDKLASALAAALPLESGHRPRP